MRSTGKRLNPARSLMNNAQQKQIMSLVSAVVDRASLMSKLGISGYGTNRDLYTALGYIQTLEFDHYYARYVRQGTARKVVHAMPDASWRKKPKIIEDINEETAFEKAWVLFQQETQAYHYLHRVDKLSGIGRYAILLLGFDDTSELGDMEQEVSGTPKLVYMRPYIECNSQIVEWESDPGNERYGKPKMYSLMAAEPGSISHSGTSGIKSMRVHHSRVLHVADNMIEDETYGEPRMKPVYNHLQDLELVSGSSGEMFYRGAFPGMVFNADKDADMTQNAAQFTDEIEKHVHGLKRYMKLQGMEVTNLAPQVSSPKEHADMFLMLIAMSLDMPMRIFRGAEAGQLASGQDETAWNNKIEERREDYNTPRIIRPFVDKMIELKTIVAPSAELGYTVDWPDIHIPSEKEEADVTKIKTEALSIYADSPGASLLIPERVYLKKYLNFTDVEIEDMEKMREEDLADEQKSIEEEEEAIRKEQEGIKVPAPGNGGIEV